LECGSPSCRFGFAAPPRARALLLAALLTSLCVSAADWPWWLGPTHDGHAGAGEKLKEKIPADLTPVFKLQIGTGFSGPVVAGDHLVYVDGVAENEVAHCVDLKSTQEVWQQAFAKKYTDEWGSGTRATPIIDDNRVYAQSCNGEFRCFNLADGKVIWAVSFEKDFGVKFLGSKANEGTASRRGNDGSPVIDRDLIFVPVGQTDGASVVALKKDTGKAVWKSGNDEAAYSSIVVADIAGVRQVVHFNAEGLAGYARDDGKLLWRVPIVTNAKRHAMTPVIIGDNIVINTHTVGMISYLISKDGDKMTAKESWRNKDLKINLSTPVLVGGFLYNHGPNRNYVCVDASNGQTKWTQSGFGEQVSSTIVVGDKLVVVTDTGELLILKPNPNRYEELARMQVCGKTWNFPAFADGKIYVRDQREIACYAIGESTR
jgi:outer membrane protein assembly factor BamB